MTSAETVEHVLRFPTPAPRPVAIDWTLVGAELKLTGRQIEIIRHLCDDRGERAIADSLGVSAHTVHTHIERVYRKLRVQSRVQLVAFVYGVALRLVVKNARCPACIAPPLRRAG